MKSYALYQALNALGDPFEGSLCDNADTAHMPGLLDLFQVTGSSPPACGCVKVSRAIARTPRPWTGWITKGAARQLRFFRTRRFLADSRMTAYGGNPNLAHRSALRGVSKVLDHGEKAQAMPTQIVTASTLEREVGRWVWRDRVPAPRPRQFLGYGITLLDGHFVCVTQWADKPPVFVADVQVATEPGEVEVPV